MIFYNKAIEQVNAITFPKYEPKFYDSLSVMQMGLEAGEVEMLRCPTAINSLPTSTRPKVSNFPRLTSKIALLISNSRIANNFLGGII